jgi:hypothetical protein
MNDLASSSVSFLCTSSPIQSTSQLPPFNGSPILSPAANDDILLEAPARTNLEKKLQAALHKANEKQTYQKGRIVGIQSLQILNGTYVDQVRSQLEAQEKKKKKTKGQLTGGRWAPLLTPLNSIHRTGDPVSS